jgi:hypothetical protein
LKSVESIFDRRDIAKVLSEFFRFEHPPHDFCRPGLESEDTISISDGTAILPNSFNMILDRLDQCGGFHFTVSK